MKIELTKGSICLVHGNKEVVFVSGFKEKALTIPEIYLELNGFWATLEEKELDTIFDLYVKIMATMDRENSTRLLIKGVQGHVDKLMRIHSYKRMSEYLSTLDIALPSTVEATFDKAHYDKTRAGTYIAKEYVELLGLALMLRPMFPIWYAYSDTSGLGMFREVDCLSMMFKTDVMSLPPTNRLITYVEQLKKRAVGKAGSGKSTTLTNSIKGIGTVDETTWLVANIFVGCFPTSPITRVKRTSDKKEISILTVIFRKVPDVIAGLGKRIGGTIDEAREVSSGDDDENSGYFENFSIRQHVANDLHLTAELFLTDYRHVRRRLDSSLPSTLTRICVEHFRDNKDCIREDQKKIVELVFGGRAPERLEECNYRKEALNVIGIINGRSIQAIDRASMLVALGVVTAFLIEKRLLGLAILMASSATVLTADEMNLINRKRKEKGEAIRPLIVDIDRATLEDATRYYPHVHGNSAIPNIVLNAVEIFIKPVSSYQLNLECSDELANELRVRPGLFDPAISLKQELALLIISNNRNKEKV